MSASSATWPSHEASTVLATNVVTLKKGRFRAVTAQGATPGPLRHERDLHWGQYVSRWSTSPPSRISTRTLGEETAGDGDTPCSTPSLERLPSSPGRKRPAVSRMPSGQPTERLLVSPGIPSGPSSPDMRIQQAIASLDFTALHAEALSLNYMAAPFPSPPPELEFISTGQASSEVQPSTPSDRRNLEPMSSSQSARWTAPDEARNPSPRHTPPRWQNARYDGPDSILVPDEDILTLGPMFDPLWDPLVTVNTTLLPMFPE
ncbi:hypothetical protein KXV84_006581 [Aspergillus fumigatus]|nr:hypothetical protein KXX40_004430 [Aspergillus fumigatus]KAH3551462.1 hypothetical protein KXV84_006581 [Aspergillus fumigatus]